MYIKAAQISNLLHSDLELIKVPNNCIESVEKRQDTKSDICDRPGQSEVAAPGRQSW